MATLGNVSVPGPPLNAAIALSILFLGPEIVRSWRGQTSLTIRQPWVVAFAFGLLHGFGFASALSEIGLPRGDIPLALFMFNVGVELGQLAIVTVFLPIAYRLRATRFYRRGVLVAAIEVGVGRSLLDDKDRLAKPQHLVEELRRQIGKVAPVEPRPVANLHVPLRQFDL
jgi:hypothetical protein